MYKYKVFRQVSDHSFVEIAMTVELEDAEAVYAQHEYGIISAIGGENLQLKLMPTDQPSLI